MTVEITGYGRPATEALARAVAREKAGDPLAPVTVVVPSNFAGLVARRMLGTGDLGSNGIANVSFVTPFRLAELLAAGRLGSRRPLTNPVLGAAVRVALADDPHHFAPVADHHATERALARLTGELSNVSNAGLDRVATSSPSAASAVAFHRSVQRLLDGFHDEAQVADAAARRTDLGADPESLGPIIWHLPSPMAAPLRRLMRSFQRLGRLSTIVGLTGVPDADQPVRELCAAVGIELDGAAMSDEPPVGEPPVAGPVAGPVADRIVSVTDADEEVRAVMRSIVDLAGNGVRLDRIGVFHASPDPYVRILQQQLDAGGLPSNGPSRLRLADSVAGRTLLAALDLPGQRWRRDRVMALVSGGPLRVEGAVVRPTSWERLTRQIGVVGGLSDWHGKIARRRQTLRSRLESSEPGNDLATHISREAGDLEQLASFVTATSGWLSDVDAAASWDEKSKATLALLRGLLGPAHRHTGWPESEQEGFERVESAIERLAGLDDLEPAPEHDVFIRAVRGELDVARGRAGRFGNGVVYGPLSSAVGHDLDAVFIVGCREGMVPSPRREDAILPDRARELANGELELRSAQLGEQHRQFLAAVAAAPEGRRTLTFPRGDLRSNRESLPSRWLLDSASVSAGHPVRATEFHQLGAPVVEIVASHHAGLREARTHGSIHERDLSAVERHVAIGGDAAEHPAAVRARRGIAASRARRSEGFTEWDGNLAGHEIGSPADRPLSPTKLQTWAACGYRYFLTYELRLGERDEPDRLVEISPLDRGSGVHRVLEEFLQELLDRDEMPTWDQPWTVEHRARVAELAATVFDEYEADGRTGRPVRWRITREDLLMLLDDFLHADNAHRAAVRATPVRVEMPFGLDEAEPLTVALPDGRLLLFRGKADRLDRSDDGRTFVSDYKTGKGREYERIDQGDPVNGGQTLQLGIYAEAARQIVGAEEVEAHYWQVNQSVGHRRMGYRWSEERRRRLIDVLTVIADGIENGEFAMDPGDWNSWRGTNETCTYCPFDAVCDRDRGEHAAVKSHELRYRPGLAWIDPSDDVGGHDDSTGAVR